MECGGVIDVSQGLEYWMGRESIELVTEERPIIIGCARVWLIDFWEGVQRNNHQKMIREEFVMDVSGRISLQFLTRAILKMSGLCAGCSGKCMGRRCVGASIRTTGWRVAYSKRTAPA